jgi:Fe-Mn family superoxide dismutase
MAQANRLLKPQHELPPLPFGMDALAPHISAETLAYHYGKHHRAYVNKLNELVYGTEFEAMSLPELITNSTGPVFNNAAQVWNHSFYWNCIGPKGGGLARGELGRAINASFGSFDAFATRFKSSAAAKFGSGWTWLVKRADGTLAVHDTDDADNPLRSNELPLLACDVWEHAYYIDYRNERAKYIEAFWKLVNWDFVAGNLAGR